mmetsp:Transcript_79421/g.202309  ORF Transcript_79421/g.202309 Transcript_79421/m.202309 type:complete len:239 (-) Transcript_79421:2-718(-)
MVLLLEPVASVDRKRLDAVHLALASGAPHELPSEVLQHSAFARRALVAAALQVEGQAPQAAARDQHPRRSSPRRNGLILFGLQVAVHGAKQLVVTLPALPKPLCRPLPRERLQQCLYRLRAVRRFELRPAVAGRRRRLRDELAEFLQESQVGLYRLLHLSDLLLRLPRELGLVIIGQAQQVAPHAVDLLVGVRCIAPNDLGKTRRLPIDLRHCWRPTLAPASGLSPSQAAPPLRHAEA